MPSDIVDRIYEAAFVPDGWPDVLGTIATSIGSAAGSVLVFSSPTAPPLYRTTPRTEEALREHVTGNGWRECEAAQVAMTAPPPGLFSEFLLVRDFLTPAQYEADLSRRALLRLGLDQQISTVIPTISGEIAVLTFERECDGSGHSPEAIASLNGLRPHLARAGMIAGRLALEKARHTVAAMDTLGLPAVVLTSRGKVLAANASAERRPGPFIARAFGGLALATPEANALLGEALAALASKRTTSVQSLPVAPDEDRPGTVIHVVPVRRSAYDIFTGGEVLIVANEVLPAPGGPPVNLLMGLYDLTPTEARIAAALSTGKTLQDAVAAQGIKVSTGRGHLAQIFRKTGTHQQSQLVALLAGARRPLSSA